MRLTNTGGNILKKILLAGLVLCLCMVSIGFADAAKKAEPVPENPYDWEISMQPKPTAEEEEAARWSLILENDLGIYAYDMSTLRYAADKKGQADKNRIDVTVKTLFQNKELVKNLQQKYADKLKGKEKVQYCLLDMEYRMAEKTYTVKEMRVFTNKNRLIETKVNKTGFVPVPEKTFAEAMYEICLAQSQQQEGEGATENVDAARAEGGADPAAAQDGTKEQNAILSK